MVRVVFDNPTFFDECMEELRAVWPEAYDYMTVNDTLKRDATGVWFAYTCGTVESLVYCVEGIMFALTTRAQYSTTEEQEVLEAIHDCLVTAEEKE